MWVCLQVALPQFHPGMGFRARCCWGAWLFPAAAYAALSKNCLPATLTEQVLSPFCLCSFSFFDTVASLKVCTKPLGQGGGGLSQQKTALAAPPRAQPSCTSKILLLPSAPSFRPQSERSLSDLQVGSDHSLPLDKPLGLQIPAESGPASCPHPGGYLSLPS